MAFKVYVCDDCEYLHSHLLGMRDGEVTNEPSECPKCGSENYKVDFLKSVQGISSDVPGGYDYEYGKKSVVMGKGGVDAQADAMYKASIGESPY